jgi:hypothetical protein
MVVIGTPNASPPAPCCNTPPVTTPTVPAVPALGQNVVSAPVSAVNGQPSLSRMRAVTISQGQCAKITWQLHDKDGAPVNLSACFPTPAPTTPGYKVVLRIKEQIMLGENAAPAQVDATVVNAATGTVEVQLTNQLVAYPGIFYAEMALVTIPEPTATSCVVFSNLFSLIITRSTFGAADVGGPPSIAEIRLHLRDSAPAESYLLDNLMFDDAEIALAIARPVQYWNEIPPPIGVFTTQTFPFRYHWLEGICANLFMMVAEQFRRNQLNYSAAGLALDDQNKEANYERAGQMRWQAYREWVRAKKAEINLESSYGEIGSTYQYGTYSSGIRSRF